MDTTQDRPVNLINNIPAKLTCIKQVFFCPKLGSKMQNSNECFSNQPRPCSPKQCPKFNQCNAPICPLDKDSHKRKHISGDKCCMYLLEAGKANPKHTFKGAGLSNMLEAIEVVKEGILSSHAPIKRAYKRAESTPSRMQPKFLRATK